MKYIKAHSRLVGFLLILVLSAGTIFAWYAVWWHEKYSGKLLLAAFDVGQGDSIFIQAENGNQVLIDGGPNSSVLTGLGRVMPFWDHSIDTIILTHPHADHVDGLVDVLKRYHVGMVIESEVNFSLPEYDEFNALIHQKKIQLVRAQAGQRLQLSKETSLDILTPMNDFTGKSPSNVHDSMVVSHLTHGSTTVLLMGDAERSVEYQLMASDTNLHADILKVGHHGSMTSTSAEFLQAVQPKTAIISVGKKNRYGHPNQGIIDRLETFGAKVFRTDEDGYIQIVINENDYSVTTQKQKN